MTTSPGVYMILVGGAGTSKRSDGHQGGSSHSLVVFSASVFATMSWPEPEAKHEHHRFPTTERVMKRHVAGGAQKPGPHTAYLPQAPPYGQLCHPVRGLTPLLWPLLWPLLGPYSHPGRSGQQHRQQGSRKHCNNQAARWHAVVSAKMIRNGRVGARATIIRWNMTRTRALGVPPVPSPAVISAPPSLQA